MEPIAELELVAGHPALDFLNTVEDRLGPDREDLLATPADLLAWGELAGMLEPGVRKARGAGAELRAARSFREELTTLLDARVAGRPLDGGSREALAAALAAAHAAGELTEREDGSLRWAWDPGALATVRHTVASSAGELLAGPEAGRIRRCDGPGCGWFFLDTTKRGNRRWCSMRACGQDAKSERRRGSAARA